MLPVLRKWTKRRHLMSETSGFGRIWDNNLPQILLKGVFFAQMFAAVGMRQGICSENCSFAGLSVSAWHNDDIA